MLCWRSRAAAQWEPQELTQNPFPVLAILCLTAPSSGCCWLKAAPCSAALKASVLVVSPSKQLHGTCWHGGANPSSREAAEALPLQCPGPASAADAFFYIKTWISPPVQLLDTDEQGHAGELQPAVMLPIERPNLLCSSIIF